MALVDQHDLYSCQLGLVAQHLDKASVGNLHEVLVVAFPQRDLLLPLWVLADYEPPNAFLDQKAEGIDRPRVS